MRRTAVSLTGALAAALLLTAAAGAAGAPPAAIVYQGVDPQGGDGSSIFLADAQGGHAREVLTQVEGDLVHPDWSPDGRAIAFVVDGSTIRLASSAGEHARVVVRCGADCVGVDFPAFSPDGGSISYTRYVTAGPAGPPASSVIAVLDLRSGRERVVARSDAGQVVDTSRWSRDGRRLAVGIDRFDAGGAETGSAIAVVDLRTAHLHRLTEFARYAYSPDWSPTTDELVFSVETLQFAPTPPTGPRDLFLVRADGSGLRRLTAVRGARMVWQPAFAPDGRSVLATLDEPGARRGVRVDVGTGRILRLGTASQVMTHLKER